MVSPTVVGIGQRGRLEGGGAARTKGRGAGDDSGALAIPFRGNRQKTNRTQVATRAMRTAAFLSIHNKVWCKRNGIKSKVKMSNLGYVKTCVRQCAMGSQGTVWSGIKAGQAVDLVP